MYERDACAHMHATEHMSGSEDTFGSQFSASTLF